MGIFSKKSSSATHSYISAPNTILSFKKINEPILRKIMDIWKDGRKD